mgnify:CR=1 FL=1
MQAVKLTSYNYNFAIKFEEVQPVYKLAYNHEYRNEILYLTGKTDVDSTYLFLTSTNPDAAVDVYLEAVEDVEGGVRFYFMDGATKKYLDAYQNGNYVNLRVVEKTDAKEFK